MDKEGALAILGKIFGNDEYELLGTGHEAFVFVDKRHRYKVFQPANNLIHRKQMSFLQATLGSRTNPPKRILTIDDIKIVDGVAIIVSPRLGGESYDGGHWWGIVELLNECKSRDIALTNIHPDNIRVTTSGIVYIDLGESVKTLTASYWDNMVKRAFLSFKYAHYDGLRELMRRSVDQNLPELEGVEALFHDLENSLKTKPETESDVAAVVKRDVTLLIRTCPMEWRNIEFQVKHIVSQLGPKSRFREVVVACDSYPGPYPRQYDVPDIAREKEALEKLAESGVMDRLILIPPETEVLRAVAKRWFSMDTDALRSAHLEPTIASLYALDQCRTDLVLQMDSDIMIGRSGEGHFLDKMLDVINGDSSVLSVSIPPPLSSVQPYSTSGPDGKWRFEVRCSLVNRTRLERLLPLRNTVSDGHFEDSWYRAVDNRLAHSGLACLRGGDKDLFMIHVPNSFKAHRNDWFNILKAIERGRVYPRQIGNIDIVGSVFDWLEKRTEEIVFVVRGRNVPPSRLDRCISSLLLQENQSFGIIFIDAASTNGTAEWMEHCCKNLFQNRATLFRNVEPLTALENISLVIRNIATNPDSIIALLDADDALMGPHVVETIRQAYAEGADLTVGSSLRTDKACYYPVEFDRPREHRGGNVWQQMSTFRKHLFDSINEEDLKLDGSWIPYATDWAYMLPMVEMAKKPVWIRKFIYLYDPIKENRSYTRDDRERMIGRICQKQSYLNYREELNP